MHSAGSAAGWYVACIVSSRLPLVRWVLASSFPNHGASSYWGETLTQAAGTIGPHNTHTDCDCTHPTCTSLTLDTSMTQGRAGRREQERRRDRSRSGQQRQLIKPERAAAAARQGAGPQGEEEGFSFLSTDPRRSGAGRREGRDDDRLGRARASTTTPFLLPPAPSKRRRKLRYLSDRVPRMISGA